MMEMKYGSRTLPAWSGRLSSVKVAAGGQICLIWLLIVDVRGRAILLSELRCRSTEGNLKIVKTGEESDDFCVKPSFCICSFFHCAAGLSRALEAKNDTAQCSAAE